MKKNVLRSLIMLSVILGLMACDNGGDSDNGKVVAEQYRGIYIPDRNDGSGVLKMELTVNEIIVLNSNASFNYKAPGWTVENKLFGGDRSDRDSEWGYFENDKFFQISATNLSFTKQ